MVFLDNLACICELLVTKDHQVPKVDWISKKRLEMRKLNDHHLMEVVNDAAYLSVSYDETSLHSRKLGCLGLTNEKGQYMSASYNLVLGTRGEELAFDMFEAIDKLTLADDNGITLATHIRKNIV